MGKYATTVITSYWVNRTIDAYKDNIEKSNTEKSTYLNMSTVDKKAYVIYCKSNFERGDIPLPPTQWLAKRVGEAYGMTFAEISRKLGLKEHEAQTIFNSAMRKIKNYVVTNKLKFESF